MQCFCLCAKSKANAETDIWEPDPCPISIQSQLFREPETTAQRREVGGWVDLSAVGPASGWVRGLGGETGGSEETGPHPAVDLSLGSVASKERQGSESSLAAFCLSWGCFEELAPEWPSLTHTAKYLNPSPASPPPPPRSPWTRHHLAPSLTSAGGGVRLRDPLLSLHSARPIPQATVKARTSPTARLRPQVLPGGQGQGLDRLEATAVWAGHLPWRSSSQARPFPPPPFPGRHLCLSLS